jgi:hypothetical protein
VGHSRSTCRAVNKSKLLRAGEGEKRFVKSVVYDTSRRFSSPAVEELAQAISPNYPYLPKTLTLIVVLLRSPLPSRNEKFYTCCDEPYLDISKCCVVLIEFLFGTNC